jgi:hypothetical protein
MRWHEKGHTKDGLLRHPADSPAWKHFDAMHRDFKLESQNVRLGLATDGFNPFGRMNVSYSIWPIFLIPYNLPLWICMKQSNFILSVLIPGKRSPGKDMDVYMQLTVDDLLECWTKGFITYLCRMHLRILSANKRIKKRDIECIHHRDFHNWFPDYVSGFHMWFSDL